MRVKHDPRGCDVNKGGVVGRWSRARARARLSKVEAIMGGLNYVVS